MEKMNTREDFLKRFEADRQRKYEMVEKMMCCRHAILKTIL